MTDHPLAEFMASYDAQLKSRLETNRPLLLQALQDAGVAEVTIEYDGEGDNGQINAIWATDATDTRIELKQYHSPSAGDTSISDDTLEDFVDAYCWDALGLHHSGFEINDGGFGRFTIKVVEGTIELETNSRFVDHYTQVLEV